ncbi:MAG: hypothetical protein R2705_25560, partial [Ilumatobacteraceae bacterium]
AGCFVETAVSDGTATMVASPVDFGPPGRAPDLPPPELGQHTEELLLELGHDWERIIELKAANAVL